VHVQTFERLVHGIAPELEVRHLVMEELLSDARIVGIDNAELVRRVQQAMREAASDGATVVVCTCSTIGGIAEKPPPAAPFRPCASIGPWPTARCARDRAC
jgi:hypothetical protein